MFNCLHLSNLDIEDLSDNQQNDSSNKQHKIESLERQLREKDALIEQLLDQINEMKNSFHALMERTENGSASDSKAASQSTVNGERCPTAEERTHVAKIPIAEDESYFMTYAHYDIHFEMLSVSFSSPFSICYL